MMMIMTIIIINNNKNMIKRPIDNPSKWAEMGISQLHRLKLKLVKVKVKLKTNLYSAMKSKDSEAQ